ncbi:MAG: restriction endonuclease subunit M [Clostridiales bacterium]|nr:restriction endonuclease subunit M [Clostridiales bacterium]
MRSIEEKVEEHFKKILDNFGIRHYGKTEEINPTITKALKDSNSKSGGSGNNFPDIQVLFENKHARRIPIMIEAKGEKGKLEKLTKYGLIEGVTFYSADTKDKFGNIKHKAGEANYSSVVNYAVNGAIHYANAILDSNAYNEVIAIGINGTELNVDGSVKNSECKAYYISTKNNRLPKHIMELDDDLSLLKFSNSEKLCEILDKLILTEKEIEQMTLKAEVTLEQKIKSIHQSLYDNDRLKTALSTNEKLYLFCGLIMASLKTEYLAPLNIFDFKGNDDKDDNDGTIIIKRIKGFLNKKNCSNDKVKMICSLLNPVFEKSILWKPVNGESILKGLFDQVNKDIIPCLESNLRLDFTGKILNSLNDWVSIENDIANDVVLTPRYVTRLMAKLARTDMNSFVWDRAMGSGGFLVSAMDIMIKDAHEKIKDTDKLNEKITQIKQNQLLGVEILGNIYILAILNMILMGDGSSNMVYGDGHRYSGVSSTFPATVFLLNPPYSALGKGFNFVEEALSKMTTGYACILIQENAGSGNGLPYTKRILKNNTLCASIHMADIFCGKSSVQTAIYLFKVNRPHEQDDLVKFIDFSEDGYTRQNRKKSSQEVNLRDTDNAKGRYEEIESLILGKKPKTNYYTKENGLYIEDTISLEGNDWTFSQHKKVDTAPQMEDFKKTISDYLAWKMSCILKME